MDAPLHPPLRIDALSSKALSSKGTQKRLEVFLQDFQDRTTATQGGHTVQVQKLKDALKEEREAVRAAST
ncbi:hypothetical protein DFH08DRAFT_721654 [Mycena albidolilacea]|uniref:Uncharacterized protein n=1 Tax=Mycena albidolilacea TaxID=1033008 RepID=A0AAD6Z1X0_9AGAR|nr:hypothetical protein DFH08DRAFT_721654 [Mycena albidolilacea]